jgi:hypothetical protein
MFVLDMAALPMDRLTATLGAWWLPFVFRIPRAGLGRILMTGIALVARVVERVVGRVPSMMPV